MKFALILMLICLAAIQSSSALKCQECTGSCEKPIERECTAPKSGSEAACLIYIYKDNNNKEYFEKKCVEKTKSSKYDCIDTPGTTEVKCETCMEDNCNSSAISLKMFSIFTITLAILVPKFLL